MSIAFEVPMPLTDCVNTRSENQVKKPTLFRETPILGFMCDDCRLTVANRMQTYFPSLTYRQEKILHFIRIISAFVVRDEGRNTRAMAVGIGGHV